MKIERIADDVLGKSVDKNGVPGPTICLAAWRVITDEPLSEEYKRFLRDCCAPVPEFRTVEFHGPNAERNAKRFYENPF